MLQLIASAPVTWSTDTPYQILTYFRVKMVIAMVVARQSPWQPRTDATLVTRYLYSKFRDNRPTTLPVLAYCRV